MNKKSYIIIVLSLIGLSQSVSAQQINTMYFMRDNSLRHKLNPAFQPESKFYIGFPLLSSIQIGAGNNSLSFSDIYRGQVVDGRKQTISFLHPEAKNGVEDFLDAWKKNLRVNSELNISLLSFGFKSKKSYYTVDFSYRTDVQAIIPKAIPTIFFEGVKDDDQVTSFDLHNLNLSASAYTELALGYSYEYDKDWTFGGKFKFLSGMGNIQTDFQDISLKVSKERWILEGNSSVTASFPGITVESNEDASIAGIEMGEDMTVGRYLKPSGYGVGFDLGATYKLLENLQFSASIIDFGFIHWSKNISKIKKEGDFVFDGIVYDINNDTIDYWEKYADMLDGMFVKDDDISGYTKFLTTKVFLGAEYSILEDRIGFGLLSKSYITNKKIFEELTVSTNFRPFYPLSVTISYSLLDAKWSNLGFGLNLNAGPVNLFFLADNIPLRFAKGEGMLIPTKTKRANFSFGLNFVFGKRDPNRTKVNIQEEPEIIKESPLEEEHNIQEEPEIQEKLDAPVEPGIPQEETELMPESEIKNDTNGENKTESLPEN
jgi:hypothetical protein